jgi:hypothetical protein
MRNITTNRIHSVYVAEKESDHFALPKKTDPDTAVQPVEILSYFIYLHHLIDYPKG